MNMLPSLWPGEVASYDGETRTCKVRIPGITDSSTDLPEAVIMPPIGDRAVGDYATEQRILPGDLVWLMFEGGDPRFPIIMGARTPRTGNQVDWRRWRHANIEMKADDEMVLKALTLHIQVGTLKISGLVEVLGGGITHNGKNVGSTHVHIAAGGGAETTPPV